MRRNRSSDILRLLDRNREDNQGRSRIASGNFSRNGSPHLRCIVPASEWSNIQMNRMISETRLSARFKPESLDASLRKLKTVHNQLHASNNGRIDTKTRLSSTVLAKPRVSTLLDSARYERPDTIPRQSTKIKKSHKIDDYCTKLDKRLKARLQMSNSSRGVYSIIKPFDFLVHPEVKIEELNKSLVGRTFNFTATKNCHSGKEDPSTRKMKEGLRSLEHKMDLCKRV